jgi:hypothetical protein
MALLLVVLMVVERTNGEKKIRPRVVTYVCAAEIC